MTGEKILVADTNDDSLRQKIETVIGERYKVASVPTEKGAIELIRRERFDLLIAETNDGLGLVEAVRRSDPAIAIVLIGNHYGIDNALERLKSGPQALLLKPFSLSELGRAIEGALERRRLLRDNKRLKALIPLFEISKTLMGEVELERLFDVILEIVWKETEADCVSLMLLDEAGQELVVKAALGPSGRVKNGKERVGEGLAGWVAKTAEPLMLTEETHIEPHLRRAMTEMGAFSVLCLPLVVKGRVIGVLRSSKTKGAPFSSSDLEFLSILCGQAAIAIENARLFSRVKTQQIRVEQLLKQATLAQEDERQRVSLEIHDGAAQWMVAASYRIQAFHRILAKYKVAQAETELHEIRNIIDQSIKELRRVIANLQPPALGELGLLEALHQNLEKFGKDTGIAYSSQIEGIPLHIPPILGIAVYRVTQEALTNVRKHAQATKVDVILRFQEDELCVVIRDNGKGFGPSHVLGNARSVGQVGLKGMKDRAETLGGTIAIESAEGMGTTITLTLPISAPLPRELSPMAKILNS
ncbi:MAG: GAF domain-containing protein [Dehalococcoidia bacterium]|nr:GAF domain-containing protein [Dehalococcoidia bacterium]